MPGPNPNLSPPPVDEPMDVDPATSCLPSSLALSTPQGLPFPGKVVNGKHEVVFHEITNLSRTLLRDLCDALHLGWEQGDADGAVGDVQCQPNGMGQPLAGAPSTVVHETAASRVRGRRRRGPRSNRRSDVSCSSVALTTAQQSSPASPPRGQRTCARMRRRRSCWHGLPAVSLATHTKGHHIPGVSRHASTRAPVMRPSRSDNLTLAEQLPQTQAQLTALMGLVYIVYIE